MQELHASQAMKALRQICAPTCTVLRDGHQTIVPATELVLGDIIFIRRGDVVPADVRLFNRNKYQLNCYNSDVSVHFDFAADEAPLTG